MRLISPRSTLFPYTTLFRSRAGALDREEPLACAHLAHAGAGRAARRPRAGLRARAGARLAGDAGRHADLRRLRSEEHTSELQSLAYLVCRFLLEKKKNCSVR